MVCCASDFGYEMAVTMDASSSKITLPVYVNELINRKDETRFGVKVNRSYVVLQDMQVAGDQNVVISLLTEHIAEHLGIWLSIKSSFSIRDHHSF